MILTENDGLDLNNLLGLYEAPTAGYFREEVNKVYRPNVHLLYIVMHYNGNIII